MTLCAAVWQEWDHCSLCTHSGAVQQGTECHRWWNSATVVHLLLRFQEGIVCPAPWEAVVWVHNACIFFIPPFCSYQQWALNSAHLCPHNHKQNSKKKNHHSCSLGLDTHHPKDQRGLVLHNSLVNIEASSKQKNKRRFVNCFLFHSSELFLF